MTAKIKRIVVFVLSIICGAVFFTACSFGTSVEKEKNKYNLTALVVYHANGGTFNNNEDLASVYYQAGAKALDIGHVSLSSGTISVKYADHSFANWYFAQRDDDGNVKTDDNGNVLLAEKVDFSVAMQSGDEWHVYAKWTKNQKLEVLLAADETIGESLTYNAKTYKVGDVLKEFSFDGGAVSKPMLNALTGTKKEPEGYVFANYYEDAACTIPVSWPVSAEGEENMRIYAKYLTDDWTVVDDANDARAMFRNKDADGKNSYKYYVANDIDAKGNGGVLRVNSTFSGVIRGNGYTIENLQFSNTMANALKLNETISLLGKVEKTAKISDLTIKNAKLSVGNVNGAVAVNCYFLASEIDGEAKIDNLKVDGGSIAFTKMGECYINGSSLEEITDCPTCGGELHDGVSIVTKPTFN